MPKFDPNAGPFSKIRPGKLTKKDKQYIQDYHKIRDVKDIALHLKRYEMTVRDYINTLVAPDPTSIPTNLNDFDNNIASFSLRQKPEWLQISNQFDPDELKHFEHKYNELVAQFDNDVTATEDMQIIHLIKLELLTNRILVDIRKLEKDQRRIRKNLAAFRSIGNLTETDIERISGLEESLSSLISIAHGKNKEYIQLDAEYVKQMREMKGTREQRLKNIEERKENWMALMKAVQDKDFIEQEGSMLAKIQKAVDNERKRLTDYHQYGDNQLDQPILSAETIKDDYEK